MILLPTPKQLEVFEEKFVLRYDAYIVLEDGCSPLHRRQAFLFQKKIEERTGLALHLTAGKARAGDILCAMTRRWMHSRKAMPSKSAGKG